MRWHRIGSEHLGMTRSTPPLHRHLLTRSDLARLQVPAGDVLAWLSSGDLEQIDALTAGDDPVFTVLSAPLRSQLAERLATIGKPTVVLTPLRARSFLMRAMIACETKSDLPPPEVTPPAPVVPAAPTAPPEPTAAIDDATWEMALQTTAAEIEADLEVMLRLAEEEAELERAESIAATDAEVPDATHAPVAPEVACLPENEGAPADDKPAEPDEIDDEGEGEGDDEGECFEFDDLTSAMDELLPEEPAASAPSAEPASEPEPEAPTMDALTTETFAIEAEPAVAAAEAVIDDATPDELTATDSNMPAHSDTTHDAEEVLATETQPEATPDAPTGEVAAMDDDVRLPTGDEIAAVLDAFETATAAPTESVASDEPHTEPESKAEAGQGEIEPTMPTPEAPETNTPVVEATAATTAEPADAATPAATELVTQSLARVDAFLAQLKDSLVQLAQRPAAEPPAPPAPVAPVDIAPLVQALQAGFAQSSQQAEAAHAAIQALGQQVASIGPSLEHGVDRALQAVVAAQAESGTQRQATEFVVTRTSRMPVVMLALAAMVIAWSALFWIKTGSPKLTLGTLVGGNLVACCLLAFGRQR
jgi:hypothetical protein